MTEEERRQHSARLRVRWAVSLAKHCGILIPHACEDCMKDSISTAQSVAHHDDYNFPLRVRWLCNKHHRLWHHRNQAVSVNEQLISFTHHELFSLGMKQFSSEEKTAIIMKLFH